MFMHRASVFDRSSRKPAPSLSSSGLRGLRTAPGVYGRFMEADPLGYEAGMNLYNYVQSDPINFTDPSGLCTGSRIVATCMRTDGPGSGIASGLSGYTIGGYWEQRSPSVPASHMEGEAIVVTGNWRWVSTGVDMNSFGNMNSYGRDIAAPVAERVFNEFKTVVKQGRCAIGTAGIVAEEAGAKAASFGVTLIGVGATFIAGGAISAQPEVIAGGVATADAGVLVATGGGLVALGGAAMRAIGGDYRSFITRSAIRAISRIIPIDGGSRSVGTNAANKAIKGKTNGVPTCG